MSNDRQERRFQVAWDAYNDHAYPDADLDVKAMIAALDAFDRDEHIELTTEQRMKFCSILWIEEKNYTLLDRAFDYCRSIITGNATRESDVDKDKRLRKEIQAINDRMTPPDDDAEPKLPEGWSFENIGAWKYQKPSLIEKNVTTTFDDNKISADELEAIAKHKHWRARNDAKREAGDVVTDAMIDAAMFNRYGERHKDKGAIYRALMRGDIHCALAAKGKG